jgi:hypothetical protein
MNNYATVQGSKRGAELPRYVFGHTTSETRTAVLLRARIVCDATLCHSEQQHVIAKRHSVAPRRLIEDFLI